MKKLLIFFFLLVLNFVVKAQYPVVQQLASNNTLIRLGTTYGGALKGNLIQGVYADTTEANTGYIDGYPGAIIFTTGNSTMYVRNAAATGWIGLASGLSAINIYNSDGTLSGDRILTGGSRSLTFTGLSDFRMEDVTAEIIIGNSATNRLRISSGFGAFLSLDADSVLMTRLPQSQLLSTDSVLIRTADFKVKTRAVSSIGSTYTAGNGLTLSGSQFKLGGTLTEPTIITGSGTNLLKLDGYTSANVGYLGIGTDFGYLRFGDGGAFSPTYENEIYGGVSQIGLKTTGDIYLDAGDIYTIGVPTVSSTTGRKVALIDTATGKIERIDPASLNTNIYNSDGILTGNRVLKGGLNQLRFDSLSYLLINAGYDGAIPNSLLELSDASATLEYKDNNGVLKARIFGSADGGNMYSFTDDGVGGNVIEQVEGEMSMRTFYSVNLTEIAMYADSLSIRPNSGIANIDSLRTWSGISDTTHKKPMTWDTRNGRWEYAANWPQQKINLVFGAGSGADADTTAFTTSAIYGSFYNDADTIVVTSFKAVLQGTSPDVTYKIWYNDSLNVEAGATALNTAGNQVTSTTTGTNVTSITNTKIPPGVWVWVKTSTVATKPKYFSLTINGYRK